MLQQFCQGSVLPAIQIAYWDEMINLDCTEIPNLYSSADIEMVWSLLTIPRFASFDNTASQSLGCKEASNSGSISKGRSGRWEVAHLLMAIQRLPEQAVLISQVLRTCFMHQFLCLIQPHNSYTYKKYRGEGSGISALPSSPCSVAFNHPFPSLPLIWEFSWVGKKKMLKPIEFSKVSRNFSSSMLSTYFNVNNPLPISILYERGRCKQHMKLSLSCLVPSYNDKRTHK